MNDQPYPSIAQYNKACKDPRSHFVSEEFKAASFNAFGNPILRNFLRQGAFAAVAQMNVGNESRSHSRHHRAIRFFLKHQEGSRDRYEQIGKVLAKGDLARYTANVRYVKDGVSINDRFWDFVEMDWVNGVPLGVHVTALLKEGRREDLRNLAQEIFHLGSIMNDQQVSHGDLTPENIVVSEGLPILVDYDSFWARELNEVSCSVAPGKMQHALAPNPLGPMSDRVPLAIFYLGFGAILNDPNFFTDRLELFDQSTFVFNRETLLCSGDVSSIPLPERLIELKTALIGALCSPFPDVKYLDKFIYNQQFFEKCVIGIPNQHSSKSTTPSIREFADRHKVELSVATRIYKEIVLKRLDGNSFVAPDLRDEFVLHLVRESSNSHRDLEEHVPPRGRDESSPIPMTRSGEREPPSAASRKVKVAELAKKLGMTNAELLELCKTEGVAAKTPQSTLAFVFVPLLERKAKAQGLVRDAQPEEAKPAKPKKSATPTAPPTSSPARPLSPSGRPVPPPPPRRPKSRSGRVIPPPPPGYRFVLSRDHEVDSRTLVNVKRLCFATTPPDVNKIQEFMNRIFPLERWGDLQKLPDVKISLSGPSSIAAVEVTLGLPPNYLKALLLKTGTTHIENPDSLIKRPHLVSILRSVGIQVN